MNKRTTSAIIYLPSEVGSTTPATARSKPLLAGSRSRKADSLFPLAKNNA